MEERKLEVRRGTSIWDKVLPQKFPLASLGDGHHIRDVPPGSRAKRVGTPVLNACPTFA
jgi:hypothetical protein